MLAGNPRNQEQIVDLVKIRRDYIERGYVQVTSPFDDSDIQNWRSESNRLWSLPEVEDPDSFRVDARVNLEGKRVPERLDPVIDISPVFAALARDQRIVDIARLLLGEPPILFKDKLIVKPPGVTGYPLHQDFAYIDFFGFDGSQQLAVCIAIDRTEDEAGPIEFFPRQHHRRLPSPADRPGETDETLLDITHGEVLTMNPGDLVFFNSLCPHRSAPNTSTTSRRLLFFTFNARSSGDFYDAYYRMGKP